MRGIKYKVFIVGVLGLIGYIVFFGTESSTVPTGVRAGDPLEKHVVIGSDAWEPVDRVGDQLVSRTSRNGSFSKPPEGYTLWKETRAKITAYEPTSESCGRFADGTTSIGEDAWKTDGVAVDPRAIPYGALIWIPGVGFRKADDTGAAMKQSWEKRGQYHIDLRMKFREQAFNWGVKKRKIRIYLPSYFTPDHQEHNLTGSIKDPDSS